MKTQPPKTLPALAACLLLALACGLLPLQAGAAKLVVPEAPPPPSCQAAPYTDRADVRAFARALAEAEALNEEALLDLLADAECQQKALDAISRPAEKRLDWAEYQDIFLTPLRLQRGRAFMQERKQALQAAEAAYGVPPQIVAAIIGVETMYGRITGSYPVLDALATLAFDYPPRAAFFKKELREFLLLLGEENKPAKGLKGSYAGAMGLGQFMPSSYRAYAVDFDQDGFRDIWESPADAIGSVANYLARHGWARDELVALPVDGSALPEAVWEGGLKPSKTIKELRAQGLKGEGSLADDEKATPMALKGKAGTEHWLGLGNFYAITRYNHSRLYALAVFQLSESLKGEAEAPPPPAGRYERFGTVYEQMQSSLGYLEIGVASWYGAKFHGRHTSMGEVYDMFGMSAAHRTLPLPTVVKVTNLDNARSLTLRVNDRGPFHDDRLIDLSYAAAKALGFKQKGTAPVVVEALDHVNYPGQEVAASAPLIYLQAGAFAQRDGAEVELRRVEAALQGKAAVRILESESGAGRLYKVWVGPVQTEAESSRIALLMQAQQLAAPVRVLVD